ncbi:hypothetical protein GCM10028798_05710 [Humibacter antri]
MATQRSHSVNIYDAKTHLSKLVAEVEKGAVITINRNGRPAARLVPLATATTPRLPGAWRGKVAIAEDFDDFTADDDRDWYGA